VHVLEEKATLAQTMLAHHSGAHQQLETAIDGGARDGDPAAAQRAVQIVRVEVAMVREDFFEKGLALAGDPHPALADKLKEALVFALERHG
jgi:hypothetical protein